MRMALKPQNTLANVTKLGRTNSVFLRLMRCRKRTRCLPLGTTVTAKVNTTYGIWAGPTNFSSLPPAIYDAAVKFCRHQVARTLLSALLAAACIGCGSGSDAAKKQLARLNEEVIRLQNDNDRLADRVAALELGAETERARVEPAPLGPDVVERPPLKVIRVDPASPSRSTEPSPESGSTPSEAGSGEEGSPAGARPVIRMRGKTGRVERAGPS